MASYPARPSLSSLYGYAFQYADKTQLKGRYTKGTGLASDPDSLRRYLEDEGNSSCKLDFIVYVPEGYGKIGDSTLPNLVVTDDPEKIFTAVFPDDVWVI
jgi:hypothetical protein